MKTIMNNNLSMMALAAHASQMPTGLVHLPRADAGAVAAQLTEVSANVKALREDVLPKAEEALKQAQKTGTLSAELKAQIDEILPKFNEQSTAQAKLEGKLEALETANLDMAQALANKGGNGSVTVSAGRALADSDELKAFVSNGAQGSVQYQPKAAITTAGGSGGGLNWSDREMEPVRLARRPLLIRNLVNVVPVTGTSVEYTRQTTRTNAAAPVAEQAAAPESSYGYTKATAVVKKISHITHISEEALSDAAMLAGEVDGELAYGLDLEEEDQVLAGDGVGENLSGLLTEATAFAAAAGLPDTQQIDRLRLAILQVTLADYAADAIVLNPTDWAAIELLKETDNGYLFGIPANPGQPALWRLPVVESNSMTAGEWLVGAMFMAATLYDRLENTILMSSEHGTNFIEGMITAKGTKRVALAVKRPPSLVTGGFVFI